MRVWNHLVCVCTLLGMIAISAPAHAQAPAGGLVSRSTTTLWNFLGIPQTLNKIRDVSSNRRGNLPFLERKPPLKAIADPANFESDNPAIKTAAEIKAEEDLAKQKIKAIKYLAKIGCGCYPGVKEALMAALDDCTEKVRFEAAKAIRRAANRQCEVCDERCCCDEELTKKLSDIAYERDEEGCCLEKSDRVRRAALAALQACCPGGEPGYEEIPAGEEIELPPETPAQPAPPELPGDVPMDITPLPPESNEATTLRRLSIRDAKNPIRDTKNRKPIIQVSRNEPADQEPAPQMAQAPAAPTSEQLRQPTSQMSSSFAAMVPAMPASATHQTLHGRVTQIDHRSGTIHLSVTHNHQAPNGIHGKIFHQYILGEEHVGNLEVIESRPGHAVARAIRGQRTRAHIVKGDRVVLIP